MRNSSYSRGILINLINYSYYPNENNALLLHNSQLNSTLTDSLHSFGEFCNYFAAKIKDYSHKHPTQNHNNCNTGKSLDKGGNGLALEGGWGVHFGKLGDDPEIAVIDMGYRHGARSDGQNGKCAAH